MNNDTPNNQRTSYSRGRIESLVKDKGCIDPLINIGMEVAAACEIFNKRRGIESGIKTKEQHRERIRLAMIAESKNTPPPRKSFIRKPQDPLPNVSMKSMMLRELAREAHKPLNIIELKSNTKDITAY